jgi:hypothetical protein
LLSSVFRPLLLYLPAGMEPSLGLTELAGSGLVELVRPEDGSALDQRLKPALADLQRWAGEFRDIKDLAHLRSLSLADGSEPSPLSLASAIRSYGQSGGKPDLIPHLVLHLSAWLDRKKAEIRRASAGFEGQERSLKQALGEGGEGEMGNGREEFPAGLDPLQVPDPGQDQLLRLRLKAWTELYAAKPVKAGLWLTRPEAAALLAAEYQERTGGEPEEETGWETGPLAKKAGLKVWRFRGMGYRQLLGLDDPDQGDEAKIAQVELEP